jgi:hypothetical protein
VVLHTRTRLLHLHLHWMLRLLRLLLRLLRLLLRLLRLLRLLLRLLLPWWRRWCYRCCNWCRQGLTNGRPTRASAKLWRRCNGLVCRK